MEDALQWIAQLPPPMHELNDGQRALIEADPVQAPPYNLSGAGVQAGIWDGGSVDAAHPDLAGRVTIVESGTVTSHATHVAGTMGGDGTGSASNDGNPLPSTTRALLIHAATDMVEQGSGYLHLGPDYSSGYGVIDIQRSVDLVRDHIEGSLVHGEIDTYTIEMTQSGPLKVTLVWDDAAASPNAATALVNNLDLEVVSPDGKFTYGPWTLDRDRPAQAAKRSSWRTGRAGRRDNLNVVEQVLIDNASPGLWTVRVIGANMPVGPQSYSLINENLILSSCSIAPGAPISRVGQAAEVPTTQFAVGPFRFNSGQEDASFARSGMIERILWPMGSWGW